LSDLAIGAHHKAKAEHRGDRPAVAGVPRTARATTGDPMSSPSLPSPTPFPQAPAWTARVGMLAALMGCAFLLLVLGLQFARGDLSWTRAQLSLYLHGPYGLWLRTAYCLLAVAIAALGLALQASLAPVARSRATLMLFWAGGFGLAMVAVGDSYLPEQAPALAPLIHLLAAQTAFVCVIAAVLLQSWRFRGDPRWHRHHPWAWWWGWLAFAVLFAHAVLRLGPRGVGQKAAIVLIVAWLVVVALRLARPPFAGAAPPARSRDNAGVFQPEE